ncbi:MAG: ABC transporter permease subunit [Nitrospirales bacterium]|nr:ABC transporter permease subunit [Nitrospirales bacterium]
MILPTIMLVAHASMAQVPLAYLRTAAALGLSRWSVIRQIILPTTKSGLLTGVLLGSRERRNHGHPHGLRKRGTHSIPSIRSIRTLTANMALEMGYALEHHRSALFVSGLLLMGLVALCVCLAEHIRQNSTYAITT